MLSEIQRSVADRKIAPLEGLKIISAAGENPTPEMLRDIQRLIAAQKAFTYASDGLIGDGWEHYIGQANESLGSYVVRYALGHKEKHFPAPASSRTPPEHTPLTRAQLTQWMSDHGILGVRADILQYAFAIWHVSQFNIAKVKTLAPGTRIHVGEFDYVRPAPRLDEARLAPILKELEYQRLFNDKFVLSKADAPRPPVPEGLKTLIFASEFGEFAPELGFQVSPSFNEVIKKNLVESPPVETWAEALNPGQPMGVSLRLLSQLLDEAEQNGDFFVEKSYFKKSNYADRVVNEYSVIASSRYKVTAQGIRNSLPRLIGTTDMANGASGIDFWNSDERLGVELQNEAGTVIGRASLRLFEPTHMDLRLDFARPRTRLRRADGTVFSFSTGATTAILGQEYFYLWAEDALRAGWPKTSPDGPSVFEQVKPSEPGPVPSSIEEAIRQNPVALPKFPDAYPIEYHGHSYLSLGWSLFLKDGLCIVPPGFDFYGSVRIQRDGKLYWVSPRSYIEAIDPSQSDELQQIIRENNFYGTIQNARGVLAYDLDSNEWMSYPVPLPRLTPNVLMGGKWTTESYPEGDVLVHTYNGWSDKDQKYEDIVTKVDLRGVTPKSAGQGYFTYVKPPYGNGLLF